MGPWRLVRVTHFFLSFPVLSTLVKKGWAMTSRRAGFLCCGCLCGVVVSCRSDSAPARASPIPRSNAAPSTTVESGYVLVLLDGQPLPEKAGEVGSGGCTARIENGWYRLSGNHWQSFDSVTTNCTRVDRPALGSRRRSGTIKHAGDTLVFVEQDTAHAADVVADRGLLRGDTLRTGSLLFDGPPRVYVHQ